MANHSLNSCLSTVRDAEIPLRNASLYSKPLIFWKAVVFDFSRFVLLLYLAPTLSHSALFLQSCLLQVQDSPPSHPNLSDCCIAQDNNPFIVFFTGMMNQFMRDSMANGSLPAALAANTPPAASSSAPLPTLPIPPALPYIHNLLPFRLRLWDILFPRIIYQAITLHSQC